jgi:predicted PurR-regulated permease PerM
MIDVVTVIFSIFGGVLYVTSQIVFGYIIAFFIIDDFGRLNKEWISKFVKSKEKAYYQANEISDALYGYIKGTAIVCTTVFIIISSGTYFIGLSTPLLFGTMAAVFNVIPYVGPYLAAIPIVAVALSISPMTALFAIILVGGTQFIEAYFLQPKIMGKSTHLHPVTIMVGLLIFHSLFGLIGMIIGTPIVVVLAKIVSFTDLDINL